MRFGIVTFPGSNCDTDAYHAVVDVLGEEAVMLWHKDRDLRGADVVILPGGFAYGDYLRAGAIARFSPIMQDVVAHVARGGPVLAICNGFQVACEAGLLPGALVRNAGQAFICETVHLRVETTDTAYTNGYEAVGRILRIPIAHGDGRYVAAPDELDELDDAGRVVFRYVDPTGALTPEGNPNGSARSIAGIVNARGNVLGLMPHPERAVDALLGSADGLPLFESLLARVAA
jgi:phosphoribosylformylglycinamidine synthase subunit PurQ / glutaminase